ncbi:MAG: hypothetical protein R3Y57_00515 [Erysipelotrichaceae bacterium]
MDFKEKCVIINEIAQSYRIDYVSNESNRKHPSPMVSFINSILIQLNDESKRIIVNDYFEKKEVYWYLDYYQRSTYYRLKMKAVEEFWHCLHV